MKLYPKRSQIGANVTLSGDIEREYTRLNTRAANRDQMRTPRNSTLVVTQPLFRGFRTINGQSRAEANVQAQRATLKGLSKVYYYRRQRPIWLLLETKRFSSLTKAMNRSCAAKEATQDRFRVGEITRTDVSQAEARVSGAMADRIQAEGALQISKSTYVLSESAQAN